MTYECIGFSITDKVAHLVLNRPATLNTMQPVLSRELTEVLETQQRDALQQMGWLQSGIWRTGNLVESFMAKQGTHAAVRRSAADAFVFGSKVRVEVRQGCAHFPN